jgi:hypothetical protein
MRRVVMVTAEKSPPAPLYKRGEQYRLGLKLAFPPFVKGGQGGFSNADIPTKPSHAP